MNKMQALLRDLRLEYPLEGIIDPVQRDMLHKWKAENEMLKEKVADLERQIRFLTENDRNTRIWLNGAKKAWIDMPNGKRIWGAMYHAYFPDGETKIVGESK